MVILLPEPKVLFGRLQYEAGTEAGARQTFQMLITDLVAVQYPTANEVAEPGGGDWGIETYVGRLDESVVVWQSKFFLDWKGEDQRSQVRGSFSQVIKKAAEQGFGVEAWTLCIPCILPPSEQQWFDGWAKRMQRAHNIAKIGCWNGVRLRRHLFQEDAVVVRRHYFSDIDIAQQVFPEQVRISLGGLNALNTALFVRQLEEAGHVETDAARGLFFAAEALARDLAARGDELGVAALEELHLEVHTLWEERFNAGLTRADNGGRMSGLVDQVLRDAAHCTDPPGIRLRPSHRRGIAHRLVENARAGWVRHWRDIAADHMGPSAGDVVAAELASSQPRETS